jgi:hypothetical protein
MTDELEDLLCGILHSFCSVEKPSDDDLNYFVDRLKAIQEEIKDRVPGSSKKASKSFGTSYHEYISKLSIDSTILRMTGYNFDAAKRIYCELDRDDAMKLVTEYINGSMEESLLTLEACMYGMGGSYKNDGGGNKGADKVHDLSTEEGKAAARAMGF